MYSLEPNNPKNLTKSMLMSQFGFSFWLMGWFGLCCKSQRTNLSDSVLSSSTDHIETSIYFVINIALNIFYIFNFYFLLSSAQKDLV